MIIEPQGYTNSMGFQYCRERKNKDIDIGSHEIPREARMRESKKRIQINKGALGLRKRKWERDIQ